MTTLEQVFHLTVIGVHSTMIILIEVIFHLIVMVADKFDRWTDDNCIN